MLNYQHRLFNNIFTNIKNLTLKETFYIYVYSRESIHRQSRQSYEVSRSTFAKATHLQFFRRRIDI